LSDLVIERLQGQRGGNYVLQGIDLTVRESTCTTVLGRNGMGKTTLMRAVMGMTTVTAGDIRVGGRSLVGLDTHQIAALGIGYVPQGRHVFGSLTVEENLRLGQRHRKDGATAEWSLERVYDLFGNLKERRRNGARQLSGGEQQMLAIGRALMTNPSLILMDEPSEGLAPLVVQRIADVLLRLKAEGFSILLVEQNYRFGVSVADWIYLLATGRTVWDGNPDQLDHAPEVQRAHLGV
jgi:branched-chain amino acid transport system ATP-binding protein